MQGAKILRLILFISFFLLSFSFAISDVKTISTQSSTTVHQKSPTQLSKNNLWKRISKGNTLKPRSYKDLYWHIDWFKKNPDYLMRVTKRAEPYLYLVVQEIEKAGLPIELALLPIVESAYYPFSYSHGTASGLWQFIPSTGKLYGLRQNYWVDERRSVIHSTRAAVAYLKNLYKLFNGDWLLAIASYNSGPGRVQKAVARNKIKGMKANFWNISLPRETKGYVPRLLAVMELIKNPHKYGQTITPVVDEAKLESIYIYSQLDLSLISQWTGLSLEDIYTLNPDLNRWATNTSIYELLLPIEKISEFKKAHAAYPKKRQLNYKYYAVKFGDSLDKLAKKFNSSVAYIKSINNIKNLKIKYGEKIIIPIPKKIKNYYSLSEDQRTKQRLNSQKHGKKIIHKVVKGENLWLISNSYNVPIESIVKWNDLINITKGLQIGKKLIIWKVPKIKASKLKNLTKIGVNVKRTIIYRVRSGDNLSMIAHKFGVRVSQLRKWNKLPVKKPLKIGKKLKIIKSIVKK